jgi:6-phosphogluconolactonase
MKFPAHPRLLLLVGALFCLALSAPARTYLVYIGTYTNALSQGIYVSRLDSKTGELSTPELAAETPSPCFLAISPDQKFLYTSDSVKKFHDENAGSVSAFAIDRKTGHLKFLNQKSSGGDGPCYVSVDHTGKVLLAANYNGGSIKSFSLGPDGAITTDDTFDQYRGRGTNPARQLSPHAHFITTDPGNHFALACDLGLDRVVVYSLNPLDGALKVVPDTAATTVPPGSGSRHLAFSADGKFVYVINEMGCSVTTLSWDGQKGTLAPIETVSLLPENLLLKDSYTAAEILVHGGFVYTTVRGADIVTVLSADKTTGKLTRIQTIAAAGQNPRGLGIDPTGHWLFTGNQKSNNTAEFSIDPKTGEISPTGRNFTLGAPVDFKFVSAK